MLKIISGGRISESERSKAYALWREVFTLHNPLWERDEELARDDTFFLIYENEDLVCAGRLRKSKINFLGIDYAIEGIADIASRVKGKGYGTILMQGIRRYLEEQDVLGIGFIELSEANFYRKCGFYVTHQLRERFVYKDEDTTIANLGAVIYAGRLDLVKKILKTEDKTYLKIRHW